MKSKEVILTRDEAEAVRLALNVGLNKFKEMAEKYDAPFWAEQVEHLRKVREKLKERA